MCSSECLPVRLARITATTIRMSSGLHPHEAVIRPTWQTGSGGQIELTPMAIVRLDAPRPPVHSMLTLITYQNPWRLLRSPSSQFPACTHHTIWPICGTDSRPATEWRQSTKRTNCYCAGFLHPIRRWRPYHHFNKLTTGVENQKKGNAGQSSFSLHSSQSQKMDDFEVHTGSDDPVEGHEPSYDVPVLSTQADGRSDHDNEDSLSLVSTNSSIVLSNPNERRPGLSVVKGRGWSGLSYDDYE